MREERTIMYRVLVSRSSNKTLLHNQFPKNRHCQNITRGTCLPLRWAAKKRPGHLRPGPFRTPSAFRPPFNNFPARPLMTGISPQGRILPRMDVPRPTEIPTNIRRLFLHLVRRSRSPSPSPHPLSRNLPAPRCTNGRWSRGSGRASHPPSVRPSRHHRRIRPSANRRHCPR